MSKYRKVNQRGNEYLVPSFNIIPSNNRLLVYVHPYDKEVTSDSGIVIERIDEEKIEELANTRVATVIAVGNNVVENFYGTKHTLDEKINFVGKEILISKTSGFDVLDYKVSSDRVFRIINTDSIVCVLED